MTATVTDLLPDRLRFRIDFDGLVPADSSRPLVDGCWLWTGGCFPAGYGSYWHEGRSVLVHRFVYEAMVGPLPPRESLLWLDHVCRVRACCNPLHLELVTATENQLRRAEALADYCSNGHPWATNAVTPKGRPNQRVCRACGRDRQRRYRERRSAA